MLDEGEESEIAIRSRLPVNCPSVDPDCTINVVLHVPKYREDFKECEMDDQMSHLLLTKTACRIEIKVKRHFSAVLSKNYTVLIL